MAIRDLVPRFNRGREAERLPVWRREGDPFREFHQEIDRLVDDFFGDVGFGLPSRWGGGGRAWPGEGFIPQVDVSETDKQVKISAELPGIDEKDLTVEMDDESLTIRGERKEEQEETGENWFRREQSYGTFHRVIPLPAEVNGDKVQAKFKNGVLTVTAPKRPEAQRKRKSIEIASE